MLTYLTALGLLERAGEQVTPTALGLDHLAAGSPYDLRPDFASVRERPGCAELLAVLRSGRPAAWASADAGQDWAGRLGDPQFAGRITAAMDARGNFLGPALADALHDLPVRRVLDIGGSSGVYACALAARMPVTGAVFERPPVDAAARTLLAQRGQAGRIKVISGDMFTGPLPAGFDLHLFSHVLHDWGEDSVRSLLTASSAALPPGGFLVDHDVHINATKTGPLAAAEYSVFLMHSAELAAERLKGALDGKRQDGQASQGAPLAVAAVSACGAPVQSPGEKEGRRRNPEPKDGGPQLLLSPGLVPPRSPAGTSTAGALACRAVMTAIRVLRSCSLTVQSAKRCRRYARRPASEGHPAPSRR